MIPQTNRENVVLIVDDNNINLKVLADYLDRDGHKVLIATNGERALRQVQLAPPDLILLDILMPGIDGYETCRRLKANEQTADIPVIFITALSETTEKIKAFQLGAVDYITKPFQREEVLARVNTHLTLQFQQRELKEVNAAKDRFFSILAHDLRSAFQSVAGYSQILTGLVTEIANDDLQEVAIGLERAAGHFSKLLSNLLEWGQFQRGKLDFQPECVNLATVVNYHLQLFSDGAWQKGIELDASVPEHLTVYADLHMLQTILRNLISNALKFTRRDGRVSITVTANATAAQITVTDTGIGIPSQHLDGLFRTDRAFQRYGTANERGTGLGLILCKEFVDQHGGHIYAESVENEGTSIIFTLPLTNAQPCSAA